MEAEPPALADLAPDASKPKAKRKRAKRAARGRLVRQMVPIKSIVPNPRNPRRHPPEQLERLAASIRRFGQPRDILVRAANRMIVAGHGVAEACKRAGLADVGVMLWDVEQKTADAYMLGDNRLASLGRDDAHQTRALLRELGFADPKSLGYSAPEIEAVMAEAVSDLKILEMPTGTIEDRFWISIRGPLKDQADALQRLKRAMKGLDACEVTLGTVPIG